MLQRLRSSAVLVIVMLGALVALVSVIATETRHEALQCVQVMNGRPGRAGTPTPSVPVASPDDPSGVGVAVPKVVCLGYDRHHRLGLVPIQSLIRSDGRVHGE